MKPRRDGVIGGGFDRLLGGLHVDLGGDHRDSVFLAGSGRSGTTWVADVVNHRRDYRLVFEPFHPGEVALCRGFASKQYLRPGDRRVEYLEPARKILTGEIRSPWTDRFRRGLLARRRLIKEIRANLLLGWMRANFPGVPMILLLRHPCAVVASRLALGWGDNLSETMAQEDLVEDFLAPFEDEIRHAGDAFERHLFLWCIDNYVPLMQFAPGEIHVAFYERFVADPEDEVGRLFASLGEEHNERVYSALVRPSPLTRKNATPGKSRLDAWRGSLTDAQVRRAVDILHIFGLDRLYGEGTMPDPDGARALLRETRA